MNRSDFVPGLVGELDVLAFAASELAAGRKAALATIVVLDGPFSRPLGAQLAIAEDQRFVGSISGGCLETALTEAAVAAMAEGTNRRLRYGTGSPYLDVRLPCGGGLEIAVDVNADAAVLAKAVTLGRARRPFALAFNPDTEHSTIHIVDRDAAPQGAEFIRRYDPKLRILLAGRGWEIVAMARQARTHDCEIVVASQELATLDFCRPFSDQLIQLTTPRRIPDMPYDAHTAVACLFHEHEWETGLLMGALKSDAFYVGALGSRQTHARRVEALNAMGATQDDIARLRGPIGLFASYNPASLAISALAEILQRHGEQLAAQGETA